MQQTNNVKELVEETLVDIIQTRIDAVYIANKDLPEIKKLKKRLRDIASRLIELNAELYFELEETRNELNALYDELIYRQGIQDSDEFYITFKAFGLINKKEMKLSFTGHEHFSKLWDAKAYAYNELTNMLVENGLGKEIEKAIAYKTAEENLQNLHAEVAYDNGVLDGMEVFEKFILKHITFTKKGNKRND